MKIYKNGKQYGFLMKNYKVLVTRELFEDSIKLLKEHVEVHVYQSKNKPIPRDILLKKVKDCDGIISLLTDDIDKELMNLSPNLKTISNYAVGYDNIDVDTATKKGIMVTNTPGILTDTTADLAFGLLIAISRRIAEGDRFVRDGKWVHAWGPKMFIGRDVHGKTLGIIGLGRIGTTVAKRAKGFDMRVLYYDKYRDSEKEKEMDIEYTQLENLIKKSDFITLHVPLTDETRHLIGSNEFKKMKKSAYLINTSRGPVIDQEALHQALINKDIAGAALDVFKEEPINPDSPLLKLDNIILTPHIGSASVETRKEMSDTAVKNVIAAIKGKKPPNLVNPEVLK